MKKIFLFCLTLTTLLMACNNDDRKQADSENDIDAARNFIQSSLYGDYRKARSYMLQDTANLERMNLIERMSLSPAEKKGLAEATINIHNVSKTDSATTIVIYSNSFKNNWDTLRVKKADGKWLVDFNYLFTHDQDTSTAAPLLPQKDTLKKNGE